MLCSSSPETNELRSVASLQQGQSGHAAAGKAAKFKFNAAGKSIVNLRHLRGAGASEGALSCCPHPQHATTRPGTCMCQQSVARLSSLIGLQLTRR